MRARAFKLSCIFICLLAGVMLVPVSGKTLADPKLALLGTVETGGRPGPLVSDVWAGHNEVIFFDELTDEVRFLDANWFKLESSEIYLSSWEESWMAYDRYHHQAYVLTTHNRDTSCGFWDEAKVHVIAGNCLINTFSVNDSFNTTNPCEDPYYAPNGLAFKQPFSEGNNPGRLIIDNTKMGRIDVVDLNTAGYSSVRIQRYDYRDPVPGSGWSFNLGDSLALEPKHETATTDDLTTTDLLYISDKNEPTTYGWALHALQLNHPHPTDPLVVTPLSDVTVNSPPCGIGGCQGIDIAGARDRLYVTTGNQSFQNGYMVEVNTRNNQVAQTITMNYGDLYSVHADWYDPKRVFAAIYDHWTYDPSHGLYLRLFYDGAVADTLLLTAPFTPTYINTPSMVFDPYYRRLYITVNSKIYVVQVNYGAAPLAPPDYSASAAIPSTGGKLIVPPQPTSSPSCYRTLLNFGSGSVDQSTIVTYTETTHRQPGGELYGMRFFTLTAVISGTTTPVTSFDPPYILTANYSQPEVGPIEENTLSLYRWASGQWNDEGVFLDTTNNSLTDLLNHMSLFAILGETNPVYLPLILR